MIIYCYTNAPFAKSVPRSDTLFGALAWAIQLLYGELELVKLLKQFEEALAAQKPVPFVISSFMPCFKYGSKTPIRFVPRPFLPATPAEETPDKQNTLDYQKIKKFKKVTYWSESIFNKVIEGEQSETQIRQNTVLVDDKYVSQPGYCVQGEMLMADSEYQQMQCVPSLLFEDAIARNSIDRLANSTGEVGQLYYESVVGTKAAKSLSNDKRDPIKTGFYLLVRTNGDPHVAKMIKAACYFLGDKGFGGDTTIGRGYGEIECADQELFDQTGGERLVTLSLLHPSTTDKSYFAQQAKAIYGRLERRKGFIEVAYTTEYKRVWKPTLFMLSEGSSFPKDVDRTVYGTLFQDKNERGSLGFVPYINGLAYTVAMKGV